MPPQLSLRALLETRYEDFKKRLSRRLRSADSAAEVLHETWLKLDPAADAKAIARPEAYLYRMALNVAADRYRSEKRWYSQVEIDTILQDYDDLLSPERIAAARLEIAALESALNELPELRRKIAMAALADELPYSAISKRFGIPLRTVEREMQSALEHCARRLKRKFVRRGGSGTRENVLPLYPQTKRAGEGNDAG